MILYIEKFKELKKPLELINQFIKITGYEIKIQNTSNEQSENEIKKTILFIIASEQTKYLYGYHIVQ